VVILAKDEERFIRRCIDNASWADEVIVLDSGSEDATREIAAGSGATVHEQEWLGWPLQRNRAIDLASHDWVLYLESDEIVTPELATSIREVTSSSMDPRDGYSVDRRGDFMGLLLPNPSRRSKRQSLVRFLNRHYSRWDPQELVHDDVRPPGRRIPLDGLLLHWRAFDMDEYVTALNRYATLEVEMLSRRGVRATGAKLAYRPVLRFLWCYVCKQGFKLGARGLIWSLLKAMSEYVRYAKLWEQQRVRKTLHPPPELVDGERQGADSQRPVAPPP